MLFAAGLIAAVIWAAKKFYGATEIASHPERYPSQPEGKVSKRDLSVIMANLQRWRTEGKISREEYDHMIDLCLAEMKPFSNPKKKE